MNQEQLTTDHGQLTAVLETAYDELAAWCRARGYAGHDPFDALNSRAFQATPLARSRLARLAWTQLFKRSPVNLRRLALVPAGRNAKGTALFALAALSRFRAHGTAEAEAEARALLDDLLAARLGGWGGAAWGYNFDWQSRTFFAPRGTPTVVPTAFAARAFVEAAQAFGEARYLEVARSACDFILGDLPRVSGAGDGAEEEGARGGAGVAEGGGAEVCFGYIPQQRTRIYNASLLAAETLSAVGRMTGERGLCEWAVRAARFVARRQRDDGAWTYGAEPNQSWVDNFHTAFVLLSLSRIVADCRASDALPDADGRDLARALGRGYEFWRARFFLADGCPKYYDDDLYPADIHSAAAAIVALAELREVDSGALAQAHKIARWTALNLRDRRGFFYYQRRRFYTVRTPHMRWGQAWMLYALARLLEATGAGPEPPGADRGSAGR
ncbi:MAG TPA: hypothetical protein VM864_13910 [Pyrinomonadaceae bacterium]|nr:hypothetical protein [Pyrinomonadaceae bacterium]